MVKQMMKAVVYDHYGSLDVLALKQIAVPTFAEDQVLIRVHAAGVHIGDCFGVHGTPFPIRMVSGLLRPSYGVPGFDLAGTVEAVGKSVRDLKPGDAVFGAGIGSCAELAVARPSALAPKPASLTFQQAAAIPTSATAALRALREVGKVRRGDRVLINGASGGVGSFAVQIAKSMGAEVTGVCGPKNVELVRSLGADRVIDYSQQDFTQDAARYDLIFDNIENHPLRDCRRALTPTGTLILNSGTGAAGFQMFRRLFAPLLLAPFVRQKLRRYVCAANRPDLLALTALVDAGQLRPAIDRTYPLAQTREALTHIESGRAAGKVVIAIA